MNRFVKFVSKNAYIQCALTSTDFCPAAWKAFILILGNAAKFAVGKILSAVVQFYGRFFIVALTVFYGYIFLIYVPVVADNISSPFFPMIVIGIIAFLIGGIFISVFAFSIDCIMLCFLTDETMAGNDQYGKHRPPELNKFAEQSAIKSICWCC